MVPVRSSTSCLAYQPGSCTYGSSRPAVPSSSPLDSGGRSYGGSVSAPTSTSRPAKPSSRRVSAALAPASPAPTTTNVSAVIGPGEAGERQRPEHQAEVAQRHVVVAGAADQVDDDAAQPEHDHGRAEPRLHRHEHAGEDLHAADEVHEVLRAARHQVVDPAGQV